MRHCLNAAEEEVLDWWKGMDPEGQASKEPVKLCQEMREFLEKPSPEEGADVAIALIVWFWQNSWSLGLHILRKVAILHRRRWQRLPSGHFQHVPDDAA